MQVGDGRPQPLLHAAERGEEAGVEGRPPPRGTALPPARALPPLPGPARPYLYREGKVHRSPSSAPAKTSGSTVTLGMIQPASGEQRGWCWAHPRAPSHPQPRAAQHASRTLTGVGRGVDHDGFGPGAPAALVPRPPGSGPHLGTVAGARPQVQDLSPGRPRDLQDLRGRARLGTGLRGHPAAPGVPACVLCVTFQSGLLSAA